MLRTMNSTSTGCRADCTPESNLAGMCFQQFMVIDTFYGWYLYSNQEEYLNRMIAALYLHRSESFLPSQERLPDIERRASEMAALDKGTRAAIMLNWALIKGWLCKSYPELFPMGDAGNLKDKPKPTRWLDVFDAFVGDNIPSIDNYKAMSCRDAFRLLNRKIKEAKKK